MQRIHTNRVKDYPAKRVKADREEDPQDLPNGEKVYNEDE
jgi:hypothetical protein